MLAVARVAALAGHALVWSWWSPVAYLWQDAAVALMYLVIDRTIQRTPRAAWLAYAAFTIYVAVGVPVSRVMSTPMTWTMWGAAGGALSDSLRMYVTAGNVAWMGAAIAVGIAAPYVVSGLGLSKGRTATLILVGLTLLGPTALARVDTHGLDRNAWSALMASANKAALQGPPYVRESATDVRSAGLSGPRDWRRGQHEEPAAEDLTRLRGIATSRNVMLVSLESTAAQYLSIYGAADDATPNLSMLARSAVVFEHAYAVYPESIKGLFSILCSTYPAFDRPADRYADAPCRSIASRLADHGYHTAMFHSGRFEYLGMDAVVRNRGFDVLADAGDIGGEHESSFGVDDRTTVAQVLHWIDALPRGDRFFVTYLPIAGHHPYESPEPGPFPARDEFGRYQNALRYGDTALGDLVHGLDARGLRDSTVWIVLGDHGEAFGQHDGNFGHTFQLYEENVRIPLLIAAPGAIPGPIRTKRVVSTIDIAPTILDLIDVSADDAYQGRSVFDGESRMALFFADYSLGLLGLRDGNLKYIYELDSRRARLFDLDRDPQEAHDVAAERATDVRWYAQRVRAWSAGLRVDR